MASINTGKVVAGGLLAGLVANAFDFVTNTYLLAPDWQALATAHNMDPAAMTSPAVAGTWIAIDFLFGILLVWTYAAIRPRFGAGAKTAIYRWSHGVHRPDAGAVRLHDDGHAHDDAVREGIDREHRVDARGQRGGRVDGYRRLTRLRAARAYAR